MEVDAAGRGSEDSEEEGPPRQGDGAAARPAGAEGEMEEPEPEEPEPDDPEGKASDT